jgi:hypothetical protein
MTKKEQSDKIKQLMKIMNNALLENKDALGGVHSGMILDACANMIIQYCDIIKMDASIFFEKAASTVKESDNASLFSGIKLEYDN